MRKPSLLLALLFVACTRTVPPPPTPTSPPPSAGECVEVSPCHGLEGLSCGPGTMCTEEYRMGDFCRQWLSCAVAADGACTMIADPKFDQCKACFDACKDGDAQACDESCRTNIGG